MTVSPRWPNDDMPPSSDVGNRVAGDENTDVNMPPTLFRLPNLNRAMPEPQTAPIPQPAPIQHQAPIQQQAPIQPPAPAPPATAQPSEIPLVAGRAIFDHERQAEQVQNVPPHSGQLRDEVFAARPFPDLTAPPPDTPTGRSWMEVAQQHGVVVLLLLVVVATAVFTGRDKSIDDAKAIELTEIDDGIAAQVPLPAHTHDLQTGIASSPITVPIPDSKGRVSIEQKVETNLGSVESSTAVASLEPPHTTAKENGINLDNPMIAKREGGIEQSGAAAAFVSPNVVDAQTVSNRVNGIEDSEPPIAFNPPSLEDLAKSLPDSESAAEHNSFALPKSDGIKTNPMVPVSSKTPVGISDWSQYLPSLSNATSN